MVAHETLTEPRVTIEWLFAKPRSFSNLPAFFNLNGSITDSISVFDFFRSLNSLSGGDEENLSGEVSPKSEKQSSVHGTYF